MCPGYAEYVEAHMARRTVTMVQPVDFPEDNIPLVQRTVFPDEKAVFFAMPYGKKDVRGATRDFDQLYDDAYDPAARACGLEPIRADHILDTLNGVMEAAWKGIQRAGTVIVDFTARSPDVALEFGWAICLGKRIIVLACNLDDVPTDFKGRLRPIEYSFDRTAKVRTVLEQRIREIKGRPLTENTLKSLENAEPGHVEVMATDRDFVIVRDMGTGKVADMRKKDVDYLHEVPHDMGRKFKVGKQLDGTFVTESNGQAHFSQRAGQFDPWPEIESLYPAQTTFTGRVIKKTPHGVFVAVKHGVNGYAHTSEEENVSLEEGMEVSATVNSLERDRQRLTLVLNRGSVPPVRELPEVGEEYEGSVIKVAPEEDGKGGFILVRLDELRKKAMIHVNEMSPQLRGDMNSGNLGIGISLRVKVHHTDKSMGRIYLTDLLSIPNAASGEENNDGP
jgi:hypothetical protein